MTYRPGGVTALIILFTIFGVVALIFAIAIEVVLVPPNISTAFLNWLFPSMLSVFFGFPLENVLILAATAATIATIISQQSMGIYHILTVGVIVIAALWFLAAFGLFKMKKWGYYLTLILGILEIVGGTIDLLLLEIAGLAAVIFGIIIVVYLLRGNVKYEFE